VKRSFRAKRLILKTIATAKRFRFWLSAAVGSLIFIQIVAFSPKKLEEEGAPDAIEATSLRPEYKDSFVSPTIPKDRVPEYTVEGFQQVSIQAGVKQFRIQADRAFFYQTDGIVHGRGVKADLYDSAGKITVITSKEAKYFMATQDLELFGDVKTLFPTGLGTESPYMHYDAKSRNVRVPMAYPVTGKSNPVAGTPPSAERFEFRSMGMDYAAVDDRLVLLSEVGVRVIKQNSKRNTEVTTIESDRAEIERKKSTIQFTMLPSRPAETRFVRISEPGMNSRSRRAEFRIDANPRKIRTVRAMDDVRIEEKPKLSAEDQMNPRRRARADKSRYATAGIAEFDSQRNLIILRDYPQVYSDHDTLTGETIVVHRDSDLVEVDQSNAFSEGQFEESP
jgi:LPS export ABC transporter protein LptC